MFNRVMICGLLACMFACGSAPAGRDGLPGAAGPSGDKGDEGSTGAKGDKGDTGNVGNTGNTGAAGAQGEKGDKGDKGDIGAQGSQGPQGNPGPSGFDGSKITGSIYCNALLANANSYSFDYTVIQFANGNVMAIGGIRDSSVETQSTSEYVQTQIGWDTAQVVVQHDAYLPIDGGWWSMSLDRSTLITSIVYHDVDITAPTPGIISWQLLSSACIVSTY